MGKPYIDFVAVKSAVSITQVLERFGLMAGMRSIRNGDGYEGRCPIHKGTSDDQFKVSVSKNCWNCFGSECKAGGNVLDFVAKMENVDPLEAAHRLNEWFNLGFDKQPPPSREERPREDARARTSTSGGGGALGSHAGPSVPQPTDNQPSEQSGTNDPLKFELKGLNADHAYFAERGLTPESVATFGLGHCTKGTMAGRIVIPLHNTDGQLVGYAGRWPGDPGKERPKYKLPKDFLKSAEVFNLHRAIKEDTSLPLIVTEGFFDVMALWQQGYRRTVSIMGSHLSTRQEQLLLTASGRKSGIILLFDEDDAGRNGRDKALLQLAQHRVVRVAVLPRESVQPDHLTADELRALLS